MKSMVCSFALLLCLMACPIITQAQTKVKTINVTFTTIDVPGAGYTEATGVNNEGVVVGIYGDSTSTDSHGFSLTAGSFQYFEYPGQTFTVPMGINDSGLIVGHAGESPVIGFEYDGTVFAQLKDRSYSAVFGDGINNAGEVVGGFGTPYVTRGFQMRGGRYKSINFPGQYTYAAATGINTANVIVGWTSSPDQAYIYINGTFRTVDFPGASDTTVWGINDSNTFVGSYSSSNCICGFVSKNGRFASIAYPGAVATGANGINSLGEIVGEYTFDYQTWHAFVTDPISDIDFR
jgi:probable HAF family extracellular repeat protein